jgi:hypothetical protein
MDAERVHRARRGWRVVLAHSRRLA